MRRLLGGLLGLVLVLAALAVPSPADAATSGDLVFSSGDLYLVHADGTGVRRLTFNGDSHDPAWSPDGRSVAYDHAGDIWGVVVLQAFHCLGQRRFPNADPPLPAMYLSTVVAPVDPSHRGKPLPLSAIGVHPAVVDPWRTHCDRARGGQDFSLVVVAVAHHQAMAAFVDLIGELLDVGRDLSV